MSQSTQGLPRTTYEFPTRFEEYIRGQLGITVGHQGFDNNILMAEAFMKLLPHMKLALDKELITTNRQTKINFRFNRTAAKRIEEIWSEGIKCLILRDEHKPKTILNRIIAYRMPNPKNHVKILGDLDEYANVWEVQKLCPKCDSQLYALISDQDLQDFPQHGILTCSECQHMMEVEVESKPSLSMMRPVMPINTNPVWVWIRGTPLIRFAWEDLSLSALASKQGGFYREEQLAFTKIRTPKFTSKSEILNSRKTTNFASQKYFQITIDMEFSEWTYYYNILMVEAFELYKIIKTPVYEEERKYIPRVE